MSGGADAGRLAVDAEGAFAQREGSVNEAAGVLGAKVAIVEYLVPKGEAVTGLDVTLAVHRVSEDAVGIHQDGHGHPLGACGLVEAGTSADNVQTASRERVWKYV